ncbi:glycolate oxidase subunit GlcF [Inhella sp.]|uniref:glycolate oxidase subunit GlcF n=1 Tax=Inhella sp. TaxID=1921806 RepID=UPI0035B425D4
MHTELTPELARDPEAQRAKQLIQACVHCGFCTATCPSYQVLGNELDSPRGRIYLVKQLLEGQAGAADSAQAHLDTCLTCRACETTCPSGVQYGQIADIGRHLAEHRAAPRPSGARWQRWLLARGLTSPLFAPALALGRLARPLLPAALKAKLPPRRSPGRVPQAVHARRVLLLEGCVQPAMSPNIHAATVRVLDRLGVQCIPVSGCCGALKSHLGDREGGHADMRALTERAGARLGQAEAILSNASGCGVMVKDYGRELGSPLAAQVARATRDLGEYLFDPEAGFIDKLRTYLAGKTLPVLAYHPPCTLQHGQKLKADTPGGVAAGLRQLGFTLHLPADSHLCCGSAGTYSVLQPAVAGELRARKLATLKAAGGAASVGVASSNIGCISHLHEDGGLPVRHWIEWLDEALG